MDIILPKLGEGADSGVVVGILVRVGDTVKKGQMLLELENEKAIAPIPSPSAGRITQILVKEGQSVGIGHRLMTIDETAESSTTDASAPGDATRDHALSTARATAASETLPTSPPRAPAAQEPDANEVVIAHPLPDAKPTASPAVRKWARELGIDLSRVRGSERGGRITVADLRTYIGHIQQLAFGKSTAPTVPTVPAAPGAVLDFAQWGPVTRQPLSALRKTISRRMVDSWSTLPQVNQFDEADVTELLAWRKQYGPVYEARGVRLTLTPFILKAVVRALQQSPIFNASLDETTQEIVFKEYYHFGMAVDTEAGLLVPVIREVDRKSLLDLSRELQDLAERARARKITADEMKGGSFTISNQGGIGGGYFTPIINKPESAILGLGRSTPKPVARQNQIVIRTLLPLCVSYDHRLIDGGQAARFITHLVRALEDFSEELVKIP